MDWMTMGNGRTRGADARQRDPLAAPVANQGVCDALGNAYRALPTELPEEFRRLLAKLH